jgi:hypothetical protein
MISDEVAVQLHTQVSRGVVLSPADQAALDAWYAQKDKEEIELLGRLKDDLRPEYGLYSLRDGVRGKYAKDFRAGTNLVLLEPDVAAAFPDAKAVNEALRLLMTVAKKSLTQQPERSA